MGNGVHYMYRSSAFVEWLNIQKWVNSIENCVYYIYKISEFTEKLNSTDTLNAQICVNLMVNCAY